MRLNSSDFKRLQRKLEKAQDRTPVKRAVAEVGEDLFGRSLAVTPKDDNDLRESGNVRDIGTNQGPAVSVGFDEEYAAAVHEMPNDDTNWTTPGTGSKYLESPFAENKKRYGEFIKQAAQKGIIG